MWNGLRSSLSFGGAALAGEAVFTFMSAPFSSGEGIRERVGSPSSESHSRTLLPLPEGERENTGAFPVLPEKMLSRDREGAASAEPLPCGRGSDMLELRTISPL